MKLKRTKLNQRGQSLIEYLIIVALVAIGGIGIMRVVGQSVHTSFAKIAQGLGADVDGSIERAHVTQSTIQKKNLKNFLNGAGSSKKNDSNSGAGNDE